MRKLASGIIDGYLKLVRAPVDWAIGRLPGSRVGAQAVSRATVDRIDANVRTVAGSVLGDERLSQDARRRRVAATEEANAVDLRRAAEVVSDQAESRLEQRQDQAGDRRERATAKATARRSQATGKQRARTRQAGQTERKRTQSSRQQTARATEQVQSETAKARLPAVEEQAQALRDREAATEREDDAARLGQAAARVKAQRKTD